MFKITLLIGVIICNDISSCESNEFSLDTHNIEERITRAVRNKHPRYRITNYRTVPVKNPTKVVVVGPFPVPPKLRSTLNTYKEAIFPAQFSLHNNEFFTKENHALLKDLFNNHFDNEAFRPSQPLNDYVALNINEDKNIYQENFDNDHVTVGSSGEINANNGYPKPSPNVEILESITYTLPPETTIFHPKEYAKEYLTNEVPRIRYRSEEEQGTTFNYTEEDQEEIDNEYDTREEIEDRQPENTTNGTFDNRRPISFKHDKTVDEDLSASESSSKF